VRNLRLTDVAVGAGGDAAAVWFSKQTKQPYAYHVRVAIRASGHRWREPVSLYAGNHGTLDGPHVVVNGNGQVNVIWAEGPTATDSTHCSVRVAHGKPGAAWSLPKALSTECARRTSLTVDGRNDLVAVWQSQDTGLAMYATKVFGQQWGAAATVPHAQGLAVRGLATDRAGDSTMVLVGDGQQRQGVFVVQRHRGSAWSAPVRVSRAQPRGSGPQVAVSPRGDVTVVWSAARRRVLVASSTADGGWTQVRRLGRGKAARVAYAKRRILAVWESIHGATEFATKPPRGPWGAAVNLSGGSKRNESQGVTADDRGRVTVVWSNYYSGDIQTRTRARSGRWSAVQTVAAKGYGTTPFVDATPDGGTWITWRHKGGDGRFRARASRQE